MGDPFLSKMKTVVLYPNDVEQALIEHVASLIKNIDHTKPIYVEKMQAGLTFHVHYREKE